MEVILIIILIAYLLSPIPLLVLFIFKHNDAKAINELYKDEKRKNEKLTAELKLLKDKSETNDSSVIATSSADTCAVVAHKISTDISSPIAVKPAITPPVVSAITTTPSVSQEPVTQTPVTTKIDKKDKKLKDLIDTSNTGLVLTVGVILLLLASIGFMSATWSVISTGVRALFLLSFSAIFIVAGIFAKAKLDLPSTSLAFFSIGSAALPITIIGTSALELLGERFALKGITGHYIFAIAFASLMLLTIFGTRFFKSKVFAITSLACATSIVVSLVTMKDWAYNLDVIFYVLCATLLTVIAPIIKKKTIDTNWSSLGKVIDVYAIINHYILTVLSLVVSENSIISGIFIIVLGFSFLIGSFYYTKNNALSLPHIVLVLIGSWQLFRIDSETGWALWLLIVGIYFIALSLVKLIKKPLNSILACVGLVAVFVSTFPYIAIIENWFAIPQIIIAMCIFVIYALYKHNECLSLPVVLLFELLLISITAHFSSADAYSFTILLTNITAFVLYALINKNPLYFSFSELLLFVITLISTFAFSGDIIALGAVLMALSVFTLYLVKFKENWLGKFYSVVWVIIPLIVCSRFEDNISIVNTTILLIASTMFTLYVIGHFKNKLTLPSISAIAMIYIIAGITLDCTKDFNALLVLSLLIPLFISSYILFKEVKHNGHNSRKALFLSALTIVTLSLVPWCLIYSYKNGNVNNYFYDATLFPWALLAFVETLGLFIMRIKTVNADSRSTFIKDNLGGVFSSVLVFSFIHSPALLFLNNSYTYSGSEKTLFTCLLITVLAMWAFLYRYELRVISGLGTLASSVFFLTRLFPSQNELLILIPIALFAIAVALDKKQSIVKDPLFYGTILSGLFMFFFDMSRSIYSLIAFVIIEIAYMIRNNTKEGKLRAASLIAVTLSTVVWFSKPFWPYGAITTVSQLKLLPTTVLALLLPFIVSKLRENTKLCTRIRIIYGYILMAMLAGIAISTGKLSDRLIYAVLCIIILVVGFFFHSRQTVILGVISTICLILYLIGQVFGSKAWLIYLAISGTVLVTVAVRNEIKRRSSNKT